MINFKIRIDLARRLQFQAVGLFRRSSFVIRHLPSTVAIAVVASLLNGCTRPPTRVGYGDREQILFYGNGAEPQDVDPQIVTGVPEDHIITALFEGLVSEDPHDLHPVPGVAERWDVSQDGKT